MQKSTRGPAKLGAGYGSRGATLKGKLDQLQDLATELAKEMQYSDKMVNNEIEVKTTLENVLLEKVNQVKMTMDNEITRIKEDFDRHLEFQSSENKRFQQELTTLKLEKTKLD